jgi:hypothetical protein
MSGGTFEYSQYRIRDIADRVEREIYNSGREKTPSELKQDIEVLEAELVIKKQDGFKPEYFDEED